MYEVGSLRFCPFGWYLPDCPIEVELVPRRIRHLALSLSSKDRETECCHRDRVGGATGGISECAPELRDFVDAQEYGPLPWTGVEITPGQTFDARRVDPPRVSAKRHTRLA